ncbi:MAG TPA: cellulase family glycosylhydrolase [Opitutaceae bacterium]|nr:cellulase family glycosylhydrolase [Opitutaceae bacterium]
MKPSATLLLLLGLALAPFATRAEPASPAATASKAVDPRKWWDSPDPARAKENPEATKAARVRVEKNKFVNEAGETILFRGVSVADPDLLEYEGHWNKQLFQQVKNLGATIVRLPVHPAGWRARTPEKYIQLLDQAASWCTELGLYVIIDWHSIGNLRTGLYQNPMYDTDRRETFAFWRAIARHFGQHHTVAFYELFNEPTSFNGTLGRANWSDWRETNEELIALVRANGGAGIPLVAGFDWAYDLTPIIEDPVRAPGIAYVAHPYSNKRSQPWEPKWEEDFAFAARRFPVVATEIGFDLRSGETINDDHYANRVTRFLESHGISWLAWVYDPTWWPAMLKSWDHYELSAPGEFFKTALQRPPQKLIAKEH